MNIKKVIILKLLCFSVLFLCISLNCKTQDKLIIAEEICQILDATLNNDQLFRVSDDSICSMILNLIGKKQFYFKQEKVFAEFIIEVDAIGNIIDISAMNDFSKNIKVEIETIFRKFSPLNRFYHYEIEKFASIVIIEVLYKDKQIFIHYEPYDLDLYPSYSDIKVIILKE